ncbi:MAG: ABC transporter substrate-binding protein/permease [Treponema sp.]|nr:ABC transporter substrate-binding protein/permease [Treponema sp.]
MGRFIAVLALGLSLLTGCGAKSDSPDKRAITSLEQLNAPGRKIGMPEDTDDNKLLAEKFPQATLKYYKDAMQGYTAVSQGKLDAYAFGKIAMETAIRNGLAGVRLLDEPLGASHSMAVAIAPHAGIPDLEHKINAFLDEIKASGTLDDMIDRWLVKRESAMPKIPVPKTSDIHLVVGTTGVYEPYTYYVGTELSGYDIELAYRFAAWLGATISFKVYDYGGIVAAAQGGDVDCIFAALFVTPEREEALPLSKPTYVEEIAVMVRASETLPAAIQEEAGANTAGAFQTEAKATASFWNGILASFEKTFIREGRWRLFVQGVQTTLLITLLSILFGTLLGFGVFMLCRNGNPIANLITRFCLWLVQGMPIVVLLMVLYYIIFGAVSISGIAVAVIGFTLTFGTAIFALLRMGVGAVDKGQYEAACALGYSDLRTFFKIILPQALPHVLPAYKSEIVGLIKATAIVGYIAVQDLTKMGDIVRSRTYEAFFPLIAVTIIYFVLESLIGLLVSRLCITLNPRHRTGANILKGVKTDD